MEFELIEQKYSKNEYFSKRLKQIENLDFIDITSFKDGYMGNNGGGSRWAKKHRDNIKTLSFLAGRAAWVLDKNKIGEVSNGKLV